MPWTPSAANLVSTQNSQAQLISEVSALQPGKPFWVALHLKVPDGWHTYWRNPGDSGMETTLEWSLPPNFKAGEIQWPYPELIPAPGALTNYGYHNEVYLLVQITPPDETPTTAPATLQVHAKWLICKDICIPEDAQLTLTLPITLTGTPPLNTAWADAFAKTREMLPKPSSWKVSFDVTPDDFILNFATIDLKPKQIVNLRFFPFVDGIIDNGKPQIMAISDKHTSLTIKRGAHHDTSVERVQGVIVIQKQNSEVIRAFRINAKSVASMSVAAPVNRATAPASAEVRSFSSSLHQQLLFAFVGGLILNLMPCVFPVLSIKALSLIDKSRKAPWEVRRHGIIFTLGVLACFAIITSILMILRAGGAQIGWGFQLQSPVFVTLLAYLMFAVGLSLSGVFTLGNTLMGIGSGLAARPGYLGSFATGVLTTLVATPCTAPFMGIALGYALTQPGPVALVVFQALGFGLAFPYLLLSFLPSLFRFLPRPGPWMERFKELLAFPMYATAAWLVWVLTLQTGSEGLVTALVGIILIAFSTWLFRSTRLAGPKWRLTGSIGAIASLAVAVGLTTQPSFDKQPSANRSDDPLVLQKSSEGPQWEPFTVERLIELRAEGQPVFLNFTAAWCITCLANERVALSSPQLASAFAEKGIAYLKADWTNRNPEITQMLHSFGRSGVPLYVYYPPGAAEPITLPQLLTENVVLENLDLPINPETIEGDLLLTDRTYDSR